MTDADDSDENWKGGYGRPPSATRFKKGKSGNPKGRAKGKKNLGTLFNDALHRTVEVRDGDRLRSMSKIEAALEVTLLKALKGDHRAFAKIIEIASKLGVVELPPEKEEPITEVRQVIVNSIEEIRELREATERYEKARKAAK
jgi:hypothetical protein